MMKYPPSGFGSSITDGGTDDVGGSSSEYLVGGLENLRRS